MSKHKRSDRTKPTPATSTQVLLDGYDLLEEFQKELRRAKEANQGAKTCTAPRPREHYDDRVQGWLRQVKTVLDSIDPTGLRWCQFDQTLIPTRFCDPKNDVVPLGDYCHRLPVLLEALNNLLNKTSGGQAQEYITLDQAAALVQRSKRTLEDYLASGKLPKPDVKGGHGRPHEWLYDNIRPALEKNFGRKLPAKYPASRLPSIHQ